MAETAGTVQGRRKERVGTVTSNAMDKTITDTLAAKGTPATPAKK